MSETPGIPSDESSLTVLIRRIAEGSTSAMEGLYDATEHLLFGLIARIVTERVAAEEVLLDVYTHVWRQASTFDSGACDAAVWLTRIARAYAIERSRAAAHNTAVGQGAGPANLDICSENLDSEDAATMVRREVTCTALEALPPEQRQVIELAYFCGLSHNEIAARLALPLAEVKLQARLGMIKLSDLLRSLFDESEGSPAQPEGE